jgi:hypothetical protein
VADSKAGGGSSDGQTKAADDDVRRALAAAAEELLSASRRLRAVAAERAKVELLAEEIADVRIRIRAEIGELESLLPAGE